MAEYTSESFKNCLFNPLAKNLAANPALTQLIPKGENGEKILRYILFLYDPKSPLIKDSRNIKTRKQESARLAGFNLEKDSDFLEGLYSFKDKEAAAKTVLFLKEFIHDRVWTMIVSHEQTFYEYNERLMKPVEDEGVAIPKRSKARGDDEEDEDEGDSVVSYGAKEKDVMTTITMKSKLIKDLKDIHNTLTEYYKEMFEDDDLREKVVNNRISPETMARV